MDPRLFEGPGATSQEDQAVSTGGKDPLCREPQEGSLQRSLPLCSPPLSFSGAGKSRIHGSQKPEGDPDAPGSYQ